MVVTVESKALMMKQISKRQSDFCDMLMDGIKRDVSTGTDKPSLSYGWIVGYTQIWNDIIKLRRELNVLRDMVGYSDVDKFLERYNK